MIVYWLVYTRGAEIGSAVAESSQYCGKADVTFSAVHHAGQIRPRIGIKYTKKTNVMNIKVCAKAFSMCKFAARNEVS